jgi:holo-[acyl-carrier protein] synthase
MELFGIGIDVVETERVASSLERFGDSFRERVFTEGERAYCESMKFSERHYAARFAAKEAVVKAFGTGVRDGLDFKDVEIVRKETGEPEVVLHGGAKAFADAKGIGQIKVSLTHADHYAAANAVVMAAGAG